jgi:hypothetical protein
MNIRELTADEVEIFLDKQPFYFTWFLKDEGEYVYDPDLGGYVLVFKMQDGTVKFGLVHEDYSAGDIDLDNYYNTEAWNIFWNKAGELSDVGLIGDVGALAEGAGEGIKNLSKYAPWIVGGVLAFVFKDEIKSLIRSRK